MHQRQARSPADLVRAHADALQLRLRQAVPPKAGFRSATLREYRRMASSHPEIVAFDSRELESMFVEGVRQ